MKLLLLIPLATILIQSTKSQLPAFNFIDDIERAILVNLFNFTNELTRFHEQSILNTGEHYWKLNEQAEGEYDFIIVGSGSAGSVVANRLSENRNWRVLLLEAGETEDALVEIPLIAGAFQGTSYDWQYRTEKQPNMCLGIVDNQMPWPRGKVMGGCSVLNLMLYVRGNRRDYDKWEELGNSGWSYDDLLPYFKKSEKARRLEHINKRYHGEKGYLGVENCYSSMLTPTFLKASEEIGLSEIDYNADNKSFGIGQLQATLWNGRRNSVARAFLHPIKDRNNLDVVINAFVTKIIINEKTKKASGVEYEKEGKKYKIYAKKEVILSAGAINTPQLLILSGIGPKDHLRELGINTIQDLPVGRNLKDHLTFYGVVYTCDFDPDQTILGLAASIPSYIFFGDGPLTTPGGVEGIGFFKTSESTPIDGQPKIEAMLIRGSIAEDYGNFGKQAFKLTDQVYDSFFKPLEGTSHWTLAPILLHPESTGYLKLQSKDPHKPPLIYPNYFTDSKQNDMKTMIAGIRALQKLGASEAFRAHGATLHAQPIYGCEKMDFDSDEYWTCALRTMGTTVYHQIGTAKMGPRRDKTAVVSDRLKVHGIDALRVCDCSIMPTHISGHTNAIAIAIGEKCADFLKQTWGSR